MACNSQGLDEWEGGFKREGPAWSDRLLARGKDVASRDQ